MILSFNATILRWAVITGDGYAVEESISSLKREAAGWAATNWTSKEWAILRQQGWRIEKIQMLLEHIE